MEKRALIETRAIGIWMGLTIELAIHLFISLLETKTLEVYYGTSGNSYGSYYGYGASYSSYYSATSSPYVLKSLHSVHAKETDRSVSTLGTRGQGTADILVMATATATGVHTTTQLQLSSNQLCLQ